MPLWAWISLGVFAVLVVPTSVVAGVAGFRLWRRVAAMEQTVGRPLEMLQIKLDELNARSDAANRRAEEVNAGLGELNRTLGRLGVLSWALSDTREAISLWRAVTRSK